MRVLVTYASRHGATADIAEVIAGVLTEDRGRDRARRVEVVPVEEVEDVTGYDAVLLGSAVYVGRWTKPARSFVRRNLAALRARPVWLFSSGPVGDAPEPDQETADTDRLADLVGARGSRTFGGRLRRADLGRRERAVVRTVHAEDGDHRDWVEIRAWADEVADVLDDVGATSS
jgi:menaquinone-dependent protoporphyrinogen oxidase